MSRERGATARYGGGIDRQGQFISPQAAALRRMPPMANSEVVPGPPLPAPVPLPPIACYRADRKSWARDMTAYELALLWDAVLRASGAEAGFTVEMSVEEYQALSADCRRHFLPVREVVPEPVIIPPVAEVVESA